MRVIHFILDHRIGGPHSYVRSIVRILAPEVISTVVTTGRGEATDLALTNLRHQFRLLYPIEIIWNIIRLCLMFRARKSPHNLIFDVHGAANIAPILAARLMGIPTVWHFHETDASFVSLVRLGKAVISGLAHKYVAVAKKSAEVFGLASAVLIPGAVDAEFWRAAPTDYPIRQHPHALRLVTVGNLNPSKGVDILLTALHGLNVPWELLVVGAELQTFSDYAADLRNQADQLVRSDRRIEFAGWQPPEAVRDLLASADMFVLPSRSEACPIALLEAMAAERACIASDVGDVRKILSEPGSGIVVQRESPASLTAALAEVASLGPDGRFEMGRRARATVMTRYSEQGMAESHLKMYKELVREAEAQN